MDRNQELAGKVAVVTGSGKRSGIGFAAARALAEGGASVVLTGRRREELEEVTEELKNQGYSVTNCVADLTVEEDVKMIIDCAVESFGRLDILVNNAAHTDTKNDIDLLRTSNETWDITYKLNLMAAVFACRYAVPVMKENGGGSIINISSANGTAGLPFVIAYGSLKGALNVFTKYVATQYADDHIRCNALALGGVLTGTFEKSGMKDFFESYTLTGKLAKPEDIGEVIRFFASDASWYINGEKIAVDGGYFAYQAPNSGLKSLFNK